MRLRPDGVTKAINIVALEALVFDQYDRDVQVEIRPRADRESDVRSRLKTQLMTYDEQRAVGEFNGELLQRILYEVWRYWTVMPNYPRQPLCCYADLCQFVRGLPGKPLQLADASSTPTRPEAA